MRYLLRILLLAGAFAAATYALGWWTVPVLGGVWGVLERPWTRAARTAFLAAGLAWLALLADIALLGPLGVLARRVGGIFHLSGPVLLAITVLYAMLLAGTAAALIAALRPAPRGPQP